MIFNSSAGWTPSGWCLVRFDADVQDTSRARLVNHAAWSGRPAGAPRFQACAAWERWTCSNATARRDERRRRGRRGALRVGSAERRGSFLRNVMMASWFEMTDDAQPLDLIWRERMLVKLPCESCD
jgi:hypothetical protein